MSLLPATTYAAPPRLARGRQLKTISETEECTFALRSDSEGDDSDRTIIARPAGLDAKLATAAQRRSRLSNSTFDESSSVESSPCSTGSADDAFRRAVGRASYADSDIGTVFSEDSCPSLADSNDTTFYTNSSRNSVASSRSARSTRNRYPSILIPRGSWSEENGIKEVTFGLASAQKLVLSPQTLSALPQHIPSINAPPSFSEGSSIASTSPYMATNASGPITPDLRGNVLAQGESWGQPVDDNNAIEMPIEIAIDEEQSILVSPRETFSQRESVGYSTDWSDMVVRFPTIPGATPQEMTPVEPDLSDLRGFRLEVSDNGVQLPSDAMHLLQNLTRSYSPVSESYKSSTTLGKVEMKQRSDVGADSQDITAVTPLSDYSFSQLSIPSPGGFFSSLQANSRATWTAPLPTKNSSMPTSAVAENFYDLPFTTGSQTIQTIMEMPDVELDNGPPTARQPGFEIPAEYRSESPEDSDMYGAPVVPAKSSPGYEYDAAYQQELKHASTAHFDRTNDWLSQQTSYLSALRETNPLNDPAEYIPKTPHPSQETSQDEELERALELSRLEYTKNAAKDAQAQQSQTEESAISVHLHAFEHAQQNAGRSDAFLHGSARLESVNASRLATPLRHVRTLINDISSDNLQPHSRPKYRGPYHANPRATGQFNRTQEHALFCEAERKQLAMEQIQPVVWATQAQQSVFNKGQSLACPAAITHLANTSKKNIRVLDLAGAATASWAWSVAQKYSHVKVTTVQTKSQGITLQGQQRSKQARIANHKIKTVSCLWKLPFKNDSFDIISARTLHMFLRSRPVAEVPSINKWDLTLKECLRILKPGGVMEFLTLDSHISNNSSDNRSKHSRDNSTEANISPTAAIGQGFMSPLPTATFGNVDATAQFSFGRELRQAGFDADGGCSKLSGRLEKAGFTGIRRQWVALPVGKTEKSHDNVTASYEVFEHAAAVATKAKTAEAGITRSKIGSISQANGRSRTPFPPAPRPISEVSSVGRIIEQYSNVEAVHGPVGSTADVSDVAGLVGSLLWEEWLVRHRLARMDKTDDVNLEHGAEMLLDGVNDMLASSYSKGACFRAVVGWARKPSKVAPKKIAIDTDTDSYRARAAQLAKIDATFSGYPSDVTPITAKTSTPSQYKYYGRGFTLQTPVQQSLKLNTRTTSIGSFGSPNSYTQSAVERGEVGTIPMMIIE